MRRSGRPASAIKRARVFSREGISQGMSPDIGRLSDFAIAGRFHPLSERALGPISWDMSRAFVKETDADPVEDLPDRQVSEHPNDVTVEGLAQIEAAAGAAQAAHAAAQAAGDRATMARLSR